MEKKLRLLIITGCAHDIFIYNYAKWLKASMNVSIDVFEFCPSWQQGFDNKFYDNVVTAKDIFLPKIRKYIEPYIKARRLRSFIKTRHYDIIHCHWIPSPLVLVKNLKLHCNKLVITFWGREYYNMKILGSNERYRKHFNLFITGVDAIINSKASENVIKNEFPGFKGVFYDANLGSSPLEALYDLMQRENKKESKKALNIPTDKQCVLIGYSGKALHQHIAIISEFIKHPELTRSIHILAPMTRGADANYVEKVRSVLDDSGYTYTLIEGRFLNDIEVAQLRNATDITLQLAKTDGFSRSILECLCAESLLIYGEWLGYHRHLKPNGFDGICVKSIEEGIGAIPELLTNYSKYDEMLKANHESGKVKYMWSECIKDWVNAYKDLLS